ncbi:D-lactate dehydrogenase [cytochrome] 1, mitochondrial [Diutina catenulata]
MFRRLFSTRPPVRPGSYPRTSSAQVSAALMPITAVLAVVVAYKVGQKRHSMATKSTTALSDLEPPSYASDAEITRAIGEIRALGVFVTDAEVDIQFHRQNEFTPHLPKEHETPKWVVYPTSTSEVSEVLKILNKRQVPVVPFAGGSSLEGHFFNTRSGVTLDTSRMNKILAVHHDDLDCVVQPGVNWMTLNTELDPYSLQFGCDCGPQGQLGGMIATNASGINAVAYGSMINNVIGLTVVLADGTVVKTKQRPRKSSAGYNLTNLIVGSEGTLGIVTEATVKLHVKPQVETTLVGQFPSVRDTTDLVSHMFRLGIKPNNIELFDADMMKCLNYAGYLPQSGKPWKEVPTLFVRVGGISASVVKEYVSQIKKLSAEHHCTDFRAAKTVEEGDMLFGYRKNAFFAMLDYGRNEIDPNVRVWVTDIAVPISRLPDTLDKASEIIKSSGFESIVLAHAGDGNFHADLFYKVEDEAKCKAVADKLVALGLENEGTCTGEHGVGNAKRAYLETELGTPAIDMMRRIKMSLDPNRILNPDKVFKIDPNDDSAY